MNEIPKILEPNEEVVYEGKPKYAPYIIGITIGALIGSTVVGFIVGSASRSALWGVITGAIIFVSSVILNNLAYSRTHYAVTNKRAIIQSGIIGRDFKSIDYDRMQNVSVSVGLLGLIFKAGSIKIFTGEMETVGGGEKQAPRLQAKYDVFRYVALPYEVLKKLQTQLSKRKEELG